MKKRILSILLCTVVAVGMLVGCSTEPTPKEETKEETTAETETETDVAEAEVSLPADGKLKTGQGVVTKISSSKPATAEEAGTAQVDSALAAVTFDSEGVITKCVLDSAQTKISFNSKGEIETDLAAEQKTKVEYGDEYGMKKASEIGQEWYQQIEAYADWTIGKTLDEVMGMEVKKVDDAHPAVPDVPELSSTVSISVGDFMAAIEKAMISEGAEFDAVDSYKTGMGAVTSIAKSTVPADGEDGVAQVDTCITTLTMDDNGVILASIMDAAQTKVAFNDKGEITADLTAPIFTKAELGEDYGMVKASAIGKEWYEQIAAYSDWTTGKTIEDIDGMKVKAVDDAHPAVPDEAELTSTVSISVGDYITAADKAAETAK